MNLNVNTVRILLMGVNLGVTVFIVTGYLGGMGLPGISSMFSAGSEEEAESVSVELKKPSSFKYTDKDLVQPESSESKVRASAAWLMPKPPAPPVVATEPTDPVEEEEEEEPETKDGEPIEGGPLQKDNWNYVHGIIFSETPLKSWIRLEKKDEQKTSTLPSPSRYSRGRSSSSRSSSSIRRSSSSSKSRSASSANTITLTLEDRWFQDEEKGLDFKVHSVDADKIIYWTDNPNRKYSLPRVSESYFLEETREERRLAPKKDEEEEEEGEGEEEKKFFKRFPKGTRPLEKREEDYRKLLAGQETTGFLEPKQLGEKTASPKVPVRPKTSGSSSSGSKFSASGKPVYPKSSTSTKKPSAPKKPVSTAQQKVEALKTLQGLKNNPKYQKVDPKKRAELENLIKGKRGSGK
ncbi:MAG: hypothetical protein VX250_06665 [Planctomycetota bacterium]|nr:hypothetical protein [Planctomycetota bacterium]